MSPLLQKVREVWQGVFYSRPWLRHGPEKGQLSRFTTLCSEHKFRICMVSCHALSALLFLERALSCVCSGCCLQLSCAATMQNIKHFHSNGISFSVRSRTAALTLEKLEQENVTRISSDWFSGGHLIKSSNNRPTKTVTWRLIIKWMKKMSFPFCLFWEAVPDFRLNL